MKNNKGFISISVMYSFFLVFLLVLLFIVNGFVNNRLLLNNIKTEIKNNISDTNFARYLTNHYKELGLKYHNSEFASGAQDNSLRYFGGDYVLTETATNEGYSKIVSSDSLETKGLIDFYCNDEKQYMGYSCDSSYTYYYKVAESGSYLTYQEALEAGVSQGYLTNNNVKNYVCFGSDETTCPDDNLYRIIGVIDSKVKLIKDSKIAMLAFDDTDTNTYINTSIYNYLNSNYLTSLGSYASKIETTTWYVAGLDESFKTETVYNIYDRELGLQKDVNSKVTAKIGLPYISEYGYAEAADSYENLISADNNWMNKNDNMWFITIIKTSSNQAFYLTDSGKLNYETVDKEYQVRPTFSLKSTTSIESGTGSQTDPYRIG